MKIIYVHCGEQTDIGDSRSYEHYWTSSWNKTWKKFRPVQDLNPWPLEIYENHICALRWRIQCWIQHNDQLLVGLLA